MRARRTALTALAGAGVALTVTGASLLVSPGTAGGGPASTEEQVAAVWRAGADAALSAADEPDAALAAELQLVRDGSGTSRSADRAEAAPDAPAAPAQAAGQVAGGATPEDVAAQETAAAVAAAEQQVARLAVQQAADDVDLDAATAASGGSAAEVRDVVAAAQERRAVEAAAAALAAAQADPRAVAAPMVAARGWDSGQFQCLDNLWTKESNWRWYADNPTSSAYGIPQSLPGVKMASHGEAWEYDPAVQIAWGLDYIDAVYGTPCSAWGHSQRVNWY